MAAITAAAGVSKTTVYHQFRSKAALFGAMVARECEQMLAERLGPDDPLGDPAETLRAIGQRFGTLLISPTALMVDRILVAEAQAFPELAEAFYEAGPKRGLARVAGWLRAQAEAGVLSVDDPEFAAEQFMALVQTKTIITARLLHRPVQQAEIDRAVERGVAMFLAYYAAR